MNIPRRLVLAAGALTSTAAALSACAPATPTRGGSTASDEGGEQTPPAASEVTGTVRVHVGDDTNIRDLWQDVIAAAFTKAYPGAKLEIQHDLHSERSQQVLARLATSGDDDPGIDLISDNLVLDAAESQLLAPVSSGSVPHLADIASQSTLEVGLGQAFPYRASSVLLAYDPASVPEPPTSLDDLLMWITENPGKFTYSSPATGGSGAAFVTSVLDLFIDPDVRTRLETGSDPADEKQWDKGFAKLKELGPSMYEGGTYPNGNNQVLELLAGGQILMAPVWSDQFLSEQASGSIPATITARQIANPPFTGGASYLGIPRSTPALPAALALADLVLSPEVQTSISEDVAGYPVLPLSQMPKKVQDRFANTDPSELRLGYSSDHAQSMNAMWDQRVPTAR